ncbi:hypothetical protein PIB30_095576 [Stylosanthes scabra]|uniref:Prenyltransferase alpha-alpha toroid domain-containing protein n=1 Tax=Stylosanthes scabra TaxID=79078 RepID=A0ABU6SW72_9FABA|nr:hypothetical protein [Stylosanthes scabra]
MASLRLMGFIEDNLLSSCASSLINISLLLDWIVQVQGMDGGFEGRPNKATDICYAFALALIKYNGLNDHLNSKKRPNRYANEQDRAVEVETSESQAWEQDDQFLILWFFAAMDPAFTNQFTKSEFAPDI